MNTKTAWVIIGIVVVLGIVYFVIKSHSPTAPTDTSTTQQNTPATNSANVVKKTTKTAAQLQAAIDSCKGVVGQKIVIDSPNGGETYKTGDSVTVMWHTCNPENGQTVSLSIGVLAPGTSSTVSQTVSFSPSETVDDGEEGVILGPLSTQEQKWPFVTPASNFVITATLNPLATDPQGAPYVHDQSDKPFTIQ